MWARRSTARCFQKVSEVVPDVPLHDLRMPDGDGLAVLRRLPAGALPVVVLTTFDTDANVQEALLAGAAGFLLKDAPAAHGRRGPGSRLR